MTFKLPKPDVPGRWWKSGLVEGHWVDTYSEPLVKQAVHDALEQAAIECDSWNTAITDRIAQDIRNLKC